MMNSTTFIKSLWDFENFEFSNLHTVFKFEDMPSDTDIYFCGESKDTSVRANKKEIFKRNYICVDFDIRENVQKTDWTMIEDEELLSLWLEFIKSTLDWDKLSSWYRYIVFSGNWFHFYYTWKREYNERTYEQAVEYLYKHIDKLFNSPVFSVDKSIKTVNRVLRLPWTPNTKRKTKRWLEPRNCEVIEVVERDSDIFLYMDKMSSKLEEELAIEYVNSVKENDIKRHRSDQNVYDAICDIDIRDIVCDAFWVVMQKDWKNFRSPRDSSNMWMFVAWNILIYSWTHHLTWKQKWYNTFSFVKENKSLDTKETFERFKGNYPHIKELDDKNKSDRKKVQQESSNPNISSWKDYCITYWELLDKTRAFRHTIIKSELCTYWVPQIDRFMQWILPEELVVIAAGSWVGKSDLCYNIWIANALKGKKVMMFALEGSLEEMALRHIQSIISKDIPIRTVDYRYNWWMFQEEERIAIESMDKAIKENLLVYNKTAKTNMAFVKEMIVSSRDEIDLFIIDHLHYIHLETQNENREVWEIMRELKLITDTLKKPVILVSHLRKPWNWDNKKPSKYDLHGSSNIAKEATTILLIYKLDSDYTDWDHLSPTWFYCAKSRAWLWELTFTWKYNTRTKQYEWDFELEVEESSWALSDYV